MEIKLIEKYDPDVHDGLNALLPQLSESAPQLTKHQLTRIVESEATHLFVAIENSKIVLVSNCGYWELDSFDLLIEQIKALCEHAEREFAGALLRPHGPAFNIMIKNQKNVDDIIEAAREAGRQLIMDGKMKPETLNTISREILTLEMYVSP